MTLIDDFVADCQLRGIRYPKTAIYYIRDFATTCEDLQNANRADLKRYLAVLRGRNLKQSSIMKAYNHLSGFYEYLVDEELVTVNPVASFRKRYLQTYKEQIAQDVRQLISIEDASRLVNSTLDSRDKAILILLFKTGMRANELLALDVGDVDILKMEIRLKPTTKRSNPLLFFDEETAVILGAWLRARPLRSTHGGDALFPSKTTPRLAIRALEGAVSRHAERVGLHDPASPLLEKRFTPHNARHWFSTWLYRAGMEERYIAWLRGDAPRGAMGPYVHIDENDVRKSYLAHIPRLGV